MHRRFPPPGRYLLPVSLTLLALLLAGCPDASRTAEQEDFTFKMEHVYAVDVQIVDQSGEPIPGMRMQVREPSLDGGMNLLYEGRTDASGRVIADVVVRDGVGKVTLLGIAAGVEGPWESDTPRETWGMFAPSLWKELSPRRLAGMTVRCER